MLGPHEGTVENTGAPTAGLGLPLAVPSSPAAPEEGTRLDSPDLPPASPFIREEQGLGGS